MTLPAGTNHQPPAESPFLSVLVGFLLAGFVGYYQIIIGQVYGGAFPTASPLLLAAAGAGAALLVGWRTETPWAVAIYRASCWVAAATWTTIASLLGDGYLFGLTVSLITVGVFCCGISIAFRYRLPAGNTQPVYTGEVLPARPKTLADQVRDAIAEASGKKPEKLPTVVLETEWQPRDAGATFKVTGVRGTAFGPRFLRDYQLEIAEILELPDGCPVQVRPGGHQNQSFLDVSLRNYLLNKVDYPRDYSPLDIRNPFPIGINIDSSPTMVELWQAAGVVIGQRGGGKTTLLHLLTLMVGRCTNALVWHIDLNNGGMSAMWLQQFARGEVDYPVVDWAAGNLDEAIIMLEVAVEIMLFRKQALAGRLAARNIDKLDVDSEFPEIIIVVDEAAQVLGDKGGKKEAKITSLIQDIQQMGRAMCVQVFLSVLRGTGDYMPSDLKKGTALALATKVKDDDELAYVFGWHTGLKSSNLTTPGMMFVEAMDRPAAITKTFFITPQVIFEATLALQGIRSQVGLGAMETSLVTTRYTERWTRPAQAKMLQILAAGEDQAAIMAAMGGGSYTPPRPSPADDDDDDVDSFGDDNAFDTFTRAIEAATQAAPTATVQQAPPASVAGTPVGKMTDDEVNRLLAAFQSLPEVTERDSTPPAVAPLGEMPPLDEPDDGGDGRSRRKRTRLAFLLDRLRDAGAAGAATGELQTRLVNAGYAKANRPGQASEDLKEMLTLGMVRKSPPGQDAEVTGRWWAAI